MQESELEAVADGRAARVRSTHYGRDEGLSSLQANFDASPGAIRSQDGCGFSQMPMRSALAVVQSGKPARGAVAAASIADADGRG